MAGCGFDAAVAQAANEAKKQGKSGVFTYIAQLVLCLFRYRESPAIIRINNQEFRTNLFTVLAGMGKYAGKGMKLLPLANPLSGQTIQRQFCPDEGSEYPPGYGIAHPGRQQYTSSGRRRIAWNLSGKYDIFPR